MTKLIFGKEFRARALGTAAIGLLLVTPGFAQQRPQQADIESVIDMATIMIMSAGPDVKVTVGSKNYDAATGALKLSNIEVSRPNDNDSSGKIDSITAENLTLDQGGGLAADSFEVTGFKLTSTRRDGTDVFEYSVPSISLKQARMPLSLPKPDANGLTDYLGWAKGFSWSSFVIAPSSGMVRGENGRLDVQAEVAEQNFGKLADGVIDSIRMFDMTANGKVPKDGSDTESADFDMTLGAQTVEGLNFGAYTLFMTGVGEKGARTPISMVKKADLGAVNVKVGDVVDIKFLGAESSEVIMRPMRVGYGEILTQLAAGKGEPNLSPSGSPEELRLWGMFFEDLPDLFEVKQVIYRGLDVVFSDKGNSGTIKLGAIEAENIKSVSYGRLSFKNFELAVLEKGVPIDARFELLEIRDLDLSGVYKELGGMFRSRFVPNFSSIERNLPLLGKWQLVGFKASKKDEGDFSVKRIALDFGAYVGVIPGSIDFAVDEFSFSGKALTEGGSPTLAELGYDTLTFSAGFKLYYDAAKSAIIAGPVFFSGKDMGTFTLNVQFGGVSRVLLSVASVAGAAMNSGASYLDGIRFDGFTFEASDAELLNRLLAYEGKKENKSLSEMKAEAKDKASIGIGSSMLPAPIASKIAPAIDAFIDNPGSLRIVVQATEPVSLRDFLDFDKKPELMQRFSVEAVANAQ